MKMKTVLCFGNEYIKDDALAKELADELVVRGFSFVKCDNLNQVLDYKEDELIILDVAKGISEVKVVDDIDKLKTNSIVSLHDFDLGYFLKLMKQAGKIKKMKIIALPIGMKKEKAKSEIKKILGSL